MEILGLFIFLVFVFGCIAAAKSSSSSSSSLNTYTRIGVIDSEEYKQWMQERAANKTFSSFDSWKSEKSLLLIQANFEKQYLELVELGVKNENVKRRSCIRRSNDIYHGLKDDFTRQYGVHPDEAKLISSWNNLKIFRNSLMPGFQGLRKKRVSTPQFTKEEFERGRAELLTIEHEWSLLNSRLSNDFYATETINISRDDFVLTFIKPRPNDSYPAAAGLWEARSKIFARKIYDGISSITAISVSRNEAVFRLQQEIYTNNTVKSGFVAAPFNPMDVDL